MLVCEHGRSSHLLVSSFFPQCCGVFNVEVSYPLGQFSSFQFLCPLQLLFTYLLLDAIMDRSFIPLCVCGVCICVYVWVHFPVRAQVGTRGQHLVPLHNSPLCCCCFV